MTRLLLTAGIGALVASTFTTALSLPKNELEYCSVYHQGSTSECQVVPDNFLGARDTTTTCSGSNPRALEDAFAALSVLQNIYFEAFDGVWPKSIDWTGAVVETVVTGMLTTLTKSLDSTEKGHDWKEKENLISSIFAQVTHSFFGQNAIGILDQVRGPTASLPSYTSLTSFDSGIR